MGILDSTWLIPEPAQQMARLNEPDRNTSGSLTFDKQ